MNHFRIRSALAATLLLAPLAGLVLIGYQHFDNIQTGVAVGSLYLLLPSR